MIKSLRANKSFLIYLFLFSFIIRAAVFIAYLSKSENFWQVDSNTYHEVATQIADGNGISTLQGNPNFYRLPGYPVFLALYYKTFGADKKNVLWLQIFLAAFIPLLIFLLSLALFPKKLLLAKAAGAYSAIHLGLVLYSGFFMTESLFIFLFLIFAVLFFASVHVRFCPSKNSFEDLDSKSNDIPFRYFALPDPIASSEPYLILFEEMFASDIDEMAHLCCYPKQTSPTIALFLGSGIALGFASLVRPVGHYLIILAILLIIFSNEIFISKIKKCFLISFGWIIPVGFWLARNYILAGTIFFHTLPGGHFLYLSASRIAMHVHNCSYQEARSILKEEVEGLIKQKENEKNENLSEIEKCKIHENLAIKYFKMQPFLAIKYWLTDMMRTSLSLYSAEILYLESGRQDFDYFNKNRTTSSMFRRYFFPQTDKIWLNFLIWIEILLYLLTLIGVCAGAVKIIIQSIKNWTDENKKLICAWTAVTPFMAIFIFVALAGGYARMRLPIEPFLIIFSLSFWVSLFVREKIKS